MKEKNGVNPVEHQKPEIKIVIDRFLASGDNKLNLNNSALEGLSREDVDSLREKLVEDKVLIRREKGATKIYELNTEYIRVNILPFLKEILKNFKGEIKTDLVMRELNKPGKVALTGVNGNLIKASLYLLVAEGFLTNGEKDGRFSLVDTGNGDTFVNPKDIIVSSDRDSIPLPSKPDKKPKPEVNPDKLLHLKDLPPGTLDAWSTVLDFYGWMRWSELVYSKRIPKDQVIEIQNALEELGLISITKAKEGSKKRVQEAHVISDVLAILEIEDVLLLLNAGFKFGAGGAREKINSVSIGNIGRKIEKLFKAEDKGIKNEIDILMEKMAVVDNVLKIYNFLFKGVLKTGRDAGKLKPESIAFDIRYLGKELDYIDEKLGTLDSMISKVQGMLDASEDDTEKVFLTNALTKLTETKTKLNSEKARVAQSLKDKNEYYQKLQEKNEEDSNTDEVIDISTPEPVIPVEDIVEEEPATIPEVVTDSEGVAIDQPIPKTREALKEELESLKNLLVEEGELNFGQKIRRLELQLALYKLDVEDLTEDSPEEAEEILKRISTNLVINRVQINALFRNCNSEEEEKLLKINKEYSELQKSIEERISNEVGEPDSSSEDDDNVIDLSIPDTSDVEDFIDLPDIESNPSSVEVVNDDVDNNEIKGGTTNSEKITYLALEIGKLDKIGLESGLTFDQKLRRYDLLLGLYNLETKIVQEEKNSDIALRLLNNIQADLNKDIIFIEDLFRDTSSPQEKESVGDLADRYRAFAEKVNRALEYINSYKEIKAAGGINLKLTPDELVAELNEHDKGVASVSNMYKDGAFMNYLNLHYERELDPNLVSDIPVVKYRYREYLADKLEVLNSARKKGFRNRKERKEAFARLAFLYDVPVDSIDVELGRTATLIDNLPESWKNMRTGKIDPENKKDGAVDFKSLEYNELKDYKNDLLRVRDVINQKHGFKSLYRRKTKEEKFLFERVKTALGVKKLDINIVNEFLSNITNRLSVVRNEEMLDLSQVAKEAPEAPNYTENRPQASLDDVNEKREANKLNIDVPTMIRNQAVMRDNPGFLEYLRSDNLPVTRDSKEYVKLRTSYFKFLKEKKREINILLGNDNREVAGDFAILDKIYLERKTKKEAKTEKEALSKKLSEVYRLDPRNTDALNAEIVKIDKSLKNIDDLKAN